MTSITELQLFRQCVENPTHAHLDSLALDNVPAKEDADQAKKALKLYHMVWSGLTKFLRLVCTV